MKITVQIKNVYGVKRVYPVCGKAKLFTQMTGRKTLSENNLSIIKDLGFVVEVATPVL